MKGVLFLVFILFQFFYDTLKNKFHIRDRGERGYAGHVSYWTNAVTKLI